MKLPDSNRQETAIRTRRALAMLLSAAILLAFDIVAERRGARYLAELKSQVNLS